MRCELDLDKLSARHEFNCCAKYAQLLLSRRGMGGLLILCGIPNLTLGSKNLGLRTHDSGPEKPGHGHYDSRPKIRLRFRL